MFIEEKIWRVPDKLNLEHLFASKTKQNRTSHLHWAILIMHYKVDAQ